MCVCVCVYLIPYGMDLLYIQERPGGVTTITRHINDNLVASDMMLLSPDILSISHYFIPSHRCCFAQLLLNTLISLIHYQINTKNDTCCFSIILDTPC